MITKQQRSEIIATKQLRAELRNIDQRIKLAAPRKSDIKRRNEILAKNPQIYRSSRAVIQ